MEDVNRIKLVLVEKKRTNKWLSEQMGVTPSTVSKWCTNSSQPDLPSLLKIADLLEVDIRELIVREYKSYLLSQESKEGMVVNGVDIEVERKPIKNLHLAVYPPDGRVHVSAPQSYTDEQIKLFVLKKWIWLVQKRKETTSYTFQNEREYVSGEAHYYKGELYRLKVIRDNTCTFHVEIQGDYINVYVYERTTKENIANILWNWYKEQITPTIELYVAKWENILGVKVAEWTVQQMQSSWGKCHKDTGKIMFNLQLAKKPLNCIEYVVAHELTHLIEQNHTDKFRHILGTYLPGWQKIKEQLNEFPL